MKVNLKGCIGLAAAWFVVFASLALAQWPSDPATNMAMTTTSGEATDPHIVVTSDGGCYVSWWDNTSGHYCMYMQRLNANGDIMWAPDGLLISNHAQNS